MTSYVGDPNSLFDPAYLLDFQGPNDSLVPEDIVFFNWRFIMINNNDAQPPVSPRLESFATTYRGFPISGFPSSCFPSSCFPSSCYSIRGHPLDGGSRRARG